MAGKFWSSKKETGDPDVQYLAGLARQSGDDLSTALSMGLASLDPEQRAEKLLKVIDTLPAVMRAAILGDAVMDSGGWEQIKATMTERERRPQLVRALVELGRETRAVDLNQIPAGTKLDVSLYRRRDQPLEMEQLLRATSENVRNHEFVSLGGGSFEAHAALSIHLPGRYVPIENGEVVMLSSIHAEEPTSVMRFGKPLLVTRGEATYPLSYKYSSSEYIHPCFVGAAALDGQSLFITPPSEQQS